MSRFTVKKVLRIYRKWGCVVDPWLKKTGRRKIFNGYDMKASVFSFLSLLQIINDYNFSIKLGVKTTCGR